MLRSSEILDHEDKLVAICLGIAIGPDGVCLRSQTKLSAQDSSDLQTWIEQLAGRFIVLAQIQGNTRLYCDPSGNLSVVYNREAKTIASSVTLAIDDALSPDDEIDIDAIAAGHQRLLFGQTTDKRVHRMTPNHFLKLSDFTEERHWPRDDTELTSFEAHRTSAYDEVAARLARNVSALAQDFFCALPITAGSDSRLLLASASDVFDKIDHYYCYGLNWSTEVDAKLASNIAEHLALPFKAILRDTPQVASVSSAAFVQEEARKMYLRTGWCYKMRADWVQFVAMSPRVDVVMRGTVAEMTRANKWDADDFDRPCNAVRGLNKLTKETPGGIGDLLQTTRYSRLLRQYKTWMAGLPKPAYARLYDFAHIELWLPMGPTLEFSAHVRDFFVNPFNDRRLLQITSGVAPRARKRRTMVRNIIQRNCPSLQVFPYLRAYAAELREAPAT